MATVTVGVRLAQAVRARLSSLALSPRRWTVGFMRVNLLALCALLTVLGHGSGPRFPLLVVMAVLGTAITVTRKDAALTRVLLLVDAAVAALAVPLTGGAESPLVPYLPAVSFAAGATLGIEGAALSAGAMAFVLVAGRTGFPDRAGDSDTYGVTVAQWTIVSLTVGLCASGIRRLQVGSAGMADRYAEAYRLLDQLRSVARSLPGSLDPQTAATVLLDGAREVAPSRRGAVLLQTGERFVPLAMFGARRIPWRPSLTEPGPVRTAWERRRAYVEARGPDVGGRREGSCLLVAPLVTGGERPVGLLILERLPGQSFAESEIRGIETVAFESTPALETAMLFDELRMIAASEERSRLAREMHDGIAQDLASLGYEVDALSRSLEAGQGERALETARELRRGMTRLVSDLRLSISDLRSSVGPARAVGAALTEYARSAGTNSGITVNLTLTEAVVRLPAETEVALLRIAYEAINDARHCPGTRNLWVSLAVDPPSFRLRIDDDGEEGEATDRGRSVTVITDLAARLGAQVRVGGRDGRGRTVDVWMEEVRA